MAVITPLTYILHLSDDKKTRTVTADKEANYNVSICNKGGLSDVQYVYVSITPAGGTETYKYFHYALPQDATLEFTIRLKAGDTISMWADVIHNLEAIITGDES